MTTKNTLVDLLNHLCNFKTQNNQLSNIKYIHKFLEFCVNNLNQYAVNAGDSDWRIKEAIMCAVGELAEIICLKNKRDLRPMIEPMLKTHILQELRTSQ